MTAVGKVNHRDARIRCQENTISELFFLSAGLQNYLCHRCNLWLNKFAFYYGLDWVCLIGLAIRIVSQTVEHLCITYFFLDTELLEIFASVLILVSSYHLGVVLSFFLVVHCALLLDQRAKVYKY